MQTLARHLDVSNSKEKEKVWVAVHSWWLSIPRFLVGLSGFAVGLTLVLACLKLDLYGHIQWWQVLLPIMIALGIVLLMCTITVFLWIRFTSMVYYGDVEIDVEELRLDVMLRTAKICFLGHGYCMLLVVSTGLLVAKLQLWPNLPVAYPLSPLMFLAVVYIILGVVLKQPEVDSPWYLLIGISVLSQSIMLITKLDHLTKAERLPWAAVFIPSWITYVILLSYCALCAGHLWTAQLLSQQDAATETGPETTPETETAHLVDREIVPFTPRSECHKVTGIACWAIGFGLSQALLSLRLDDEDKVAWFAVALPAFIGWVLTVIFAIGPVSAYFEDMARLLFDTFSLASGKDSSGYDSSDVEEERQPLLIGGSGGWSPPERGGLTPKRGVK